MQVFQTWDESSILSTRTRESKNNHLWLFLVSMWWDREKIFSLPAPGDETASREAFFCVYVLVIDKND